MKIDLKKGERKMDKRIEHVVSHLKLQNEIDFNSFHVYPKFFSEGIIILCDEEGAYDRFMNLEGEWISPYIYENITDFYSGMATIHRDGRYGYLDQNGELVIPPTFEAAYRFVEGVAVVKKDGKYGVINKNGEIVIPFVYDRVFGASEGLFGAVLNGKHGFLNMHNEVVVPFEYKEAERFSNGLAAVLKKKWGFIDKKGELVIPYNYVEVNTFLDGYCSVNIQRKKWGLIDKEGNVILPFENNDIYSICDSYFNDGLCAVKRKGKWGFVNKKNEEVVPCKYSDIAEFCQGFAAVCKNEKWGFINVKGEEVIPCSYTDVWEFFQDGIAGIKVEGKYGCINEKNQLISPLAEGWIKRMDDFYVQYDKKQNKLFLLKTEQSVLSCIYWKESDFADFWQEDDYSLMAYHCDFPTEEIIKEVEEQIQYKLPLSYIELMKSHNGGILKHVSCVLPDLEGFKESGKEILLEGIFGIGTQKTYSLGGIFGSRFWIEDGGYPDIGVAICTCCSEDQDMIFLDYRECGKEGEPCVVYINPEYDFAIIKIAENFEEFIGKLCHLT